MKVVGLDISLTGTGIASTAGWCETIGRTGVTNLPLLQRLTAVTDLTNLIVDRAGVPDLVAVELPAFTRTGGGSLERHALWWRIVHRLAIGRSVPVAVVTSDGRCVYATGRGKATKEAIVEAVTRRWPQYATGGNNNACDAIVLAAMGADWLGEPLCPMPASHRRALDKVTWPEVARG
jgi:Holliday junction resolvasome RuvABC endonuclease subunit